MIEGVESMNRLFGDLLTVGGPGTNADAAMRGEIGALVRVCIDYTPQATPEKIRARAEYRYREKYAVRGEGDLKLTHNTGERGGDPNAVWLRSGGKFHIMSGPGKWPARGNEKTSRVAPGGARWPDWLWAEYQALENQTPQQREALKKKWVAQALASRGLARQSWLQIADSLGIEVPGGRDRLRAAKGSDGRSYMNGEGHNASSREVLAYELSNRMPALLSPGLDGEGILSRAMATRVAAFDKAMEKGVFDDLSQIARRYPGLLVS